MSIKKTMVSGLAAVSIAAASLLPLSTAASAHGWQGQHGNHNAYSQRINPWNGGHRNAAAYEYRHDGGDYGYHRHRNNVGGAVAVGIFATVLGLALAAESNRVQHHYYDDSND